MENADSDENKSVLLRTIKQYVDPNPEEWEAFYSLFKSKQIKKNQIYLREGEVSKNLAFICKGCFRMYYLINGEERCKDFQIEGQFTGSLYSFLSNKPALFNVAPVEDSTVLEVHRDFLLDLYDRYPVWDRFGRKYIEQVFLYKERREASLLFKTGKQRYEEMLEEQKELINRLPLKYISSYLGIKPESLSRLRKLK